MIPFLKQKHFWVVFSILSVVLIVCTTILLTPSSVPTTSVNNVTQQGTDDWKTYVSEKWGFQFEYPADWLVSVSLGPGNTSEYFNLKEWVRIQAPGDAAIEIHIFSPISSLILGDLSIDKWIEGWKGEDAIGVQKTTTTARHLDALFYKYPGRPGAYEQWYIIFHYSNQLYYIIYSIGDGGESETIYNHILSSFEFI